MKYLKLLYVQVIIGIVLGVLVGRYFPQFAPAGKIISTKFIDLIKMVIAPIIFFTIVQGIAGAGDLKKVGRVGGKGLLYFEIVTTVALFIGLLVANIIKPGVGVDKSTAVATETVTQLTQKGQDLNGLTFSLISYRIMFLNHLPKVIFYRYYFSAFYLA